MYIDVLDPSVALPDQSQCQQWNKPVSVFTLRQGCDFFFRVWLHCGQMVLISVPDLPDMFIPYSSKFIVTPS